MHDKSFINLLQEVTKVSLRRAKKDFIVKIEDSLSSLQHVVEFGRYKEKAAQPHSIDQLLNESSSISLQIVNHHTISTGISQGGSNFKGCKLQP